MMVDQDRRVFLTAAALLASSGLARPALALQTGAADTQDGLATTWDLTDLYKDAAAWDADRAALQPLITQVASFRGRLGAGASTFAAALQAQSDAHRKLARMTTYAQARANEDLSNAANQQRLQVAQSLSGQLERASAFTAPEIVALGSARVDAYFAADPRLAHFRHAVADILRQADHTLGEEAEGVIAATAVPFGGPLAVFNQMNSSDIPRPTVTLRGGSRVVLDEQGYAAVIVSPDRGDRKLAYQGFYNSIKPFEATLGLDLLAQVEQEVFTAQVRRYPDALSAALTPLAIPTQVYRTYVGEVNAGLPVYQRYLDLRRRLLGLPELASWDLGAPIGSSPRRFTPTQMRANLLAAVRPLGADYVATLTKASAARWADLLPRKNKFADNYMDAGAYDVHPYLFFNLTDSYDSMSDYAHEWGHAMHSLLANAVQPYETSRVTNFIAEVPSQLNEILLARYMIGSAPSRVEKLFYLTQLLNLWAGHFFTTGIVAEFQDRIHAPVEAGDGLTGARLTEIYLALQQHYFGARVSVDPLAGLGWARNFQLLEGYYTFQYATCITASGVFSEQILAGDAGARDQYLAMLRAGGSDYAYDLLRKAGVDLATPEPYRKVIAAFSNLLDQADALIRTS